jgi:hypothetical protein
LEKLLDKALVAVITKNEIIKNQDISSGLDGEILQASKRSA